MTQNDETKSLEEESESTQEQPDNKMETLLEEEGLNIDFPKAGEIRDGVIASISEGQILVSVGAKSEGMITGKEYEAIPPDVLSTFIVGHAIPVYVITPEDSNGNLILSFIRAVEEQSWIDAESMLASGKNFESKIVGYNKGGLLVPLGTIRGFIPASQVSLSRRMSISGETPEEKYKEMIGENVEVRVIEVDRERRRLILSERAASSETREMIKEKVIDDLVEGEVRTGRVTSLAAFGAFISISGADGLVHLSEISWDRISHPSEILKVGQEVKVKIISVDKERRRIGLSIRQLANDPWASQVSNLKVGQLVEGEITRLTNFGAFARLKRNPGEAEVEGLIHISEISERRIEHPKEVIHVGEVVTLRIVKIDEENHRIGLSIRRVDSPAYADLDWKNLAEEIDLSSSQEGEDIAAFVEGEEKTEVPDEKIELSPSKEAEDIAPVIEKEEIAEKSADKAKSEPEA
jgi:small subunit ribosomal protein S1